VSSLLRVSGRPASESSLDGFRLVTGTGARWTRETISVDAKDFAVAKLNGALGRHLDVGGLQVSTE
jgi:hypothetical protein